MNFVQKEQFTSKKASGLGVVVLFHAALAAALIYGLGTVKKPHTVEPPMVMHPLPPEPKIDRTIVDPIETKTYQPRDEIIHPIEPPPIDSHTNATTAPPRDDEPVVTHQGQGEPPSKGGEGTGNPGQGLAQVQTSSPVIANLDSCKPDYPMSALKSEQEGVVRVRFEIGADSQLLSAAVVKSSGVPALDRAALNGLSRCAFKAAMQNGAPVKSALVSDYVWAIN